MTEQERQEHYEKEIIYQLERFEGRNVPVDTMRAVVAIQTIIDMHQELLNSIYSGEAEVRWDTEDMDDIEFTWVQPN